MPGANYMGGKRNAMKARAKDTIGRQEKGHFGRQRLNMLSQGLSASKPSERIHQPTDIRKPSNAGIADIDLAHARQKIPIDSSASSVTCFMPKPIHISPSTPRSRRCLRDRHAHTSSSRSSGQRSKILNALDTSHPLFLRKAMNEILAMSDLAGLSGTGKPSTLTKSWQRDNSKNSDHSVMIEVLHFSDGLKESIKQRVKDSPDSETIDPRSKIEIKDMSRDRRQTRLISNKSHPPSSITGRFMNRNGPSFESRLLQSNRSHTRRSLEASMPNLFEEKDNSMSEFEIHDSGYSESIPDTYRVSSPLLAKERKPSFEIPKNVESIHPERASSCNSAGKSLGSDRDDYENFSSDDYPGGIHGHDGLPSFVRLGPVRGRHGTKISVYGSLYEHKDPWKTVGLILGLEEAKTDDQDMVQVLDDEDAFEMNEDERGCDSLFGDADDDNDQLSDDDVFMDASWQHLELEYVSTPLTSPQRSPSPVVDANCRDTEVRPMTESIFEDEPEHISSALDSPYDTILINQGSTLALPSTTAILELKDDIDDQMSVEAERDMSPMEEDERIGENVRIVVPELREMDGLFLGPLLFDDFEESD